MPEPNKARRDLIQQLQSSTTAADLQFRILWIYKNKEDREKYVEVMNDYLGFFNASIQAHFMAVIVILYAIYEPRADTVNLDRLFSTAPNFERRLKNSTRKRKRSGRKSRLSETIMSAM